MADDLLERFLLEEGDDYVRRTLLHELQARVGSQRYLTFNVFNVRLHFDVNTATIEDELDPGSEQVISIDMLLARLR